jgi:predicted transposase YdaD
MTAADRLRAEGRAEGEAKGKAEGEAKGKAEGKAELLLKLLTLRFGELPQAARARLAAADEQALMRFTERVLSASSLDEVLA